MPNKTVIYISTSREQRNIAQRCARCELHLLCFLEFDFVQVSSWKLPRWEEILCSSETVPKCKNFFAPVKQIDDTLHCIALLHHLLKGRAGTWQKCNFSISKDVFKCFVNISEAKLWWRHGGFERRTRRYVRLLHLWGQWQTTNLVSQKRNKSE